MNVVKKTSIRKKVSSLLVRVSLISVISISLIAIAGLLVLRENIVNISTELGETAAVDSQKALEELTLEKLATSARYHASLIDSIMYSYELKTIMLADAASHIIQNPGDYTPNPVKPPDPANAGIPATQLIWAEDIDISAISAEVAILGNIQDIMANLVSKESEITYLVGLERGYLIINDNYSHQNPAFIDPRERPWYKQAVLAGKLTWTDAYRTISGTDFSIACAMPFYDNNGNIAGVAATSQSLFYLVDEALLSTGHLKNEAMHFFLINEFGKVVASENVNIDAQGKVIWENVLDINDPGVSEAVSVMLEGESGVHRVQAIEKEFFVAYAPISTLPWSFAVAIETDMVFAPATEIKEHIMIITDNALKDIVFIIIVIIIIFVIISALALLPIGYSARIFADTLTNPITEMEEGVRRIAEGNLDHIIRLQTGDEIEVLVQSVNKMAVDLKNYIANLQTVTAEKERIGAELDIAAKIQASMLPCTFPPFPDNDEFDIYALMTPAKEVGGDFYDFFFVDKDTLAIVIADVSGKGIPAALFMVVSKTLIKSIAQSGKNPKEVFESVNKLLCENNKAGMFVTAILGYINIKTGHFSYVNAGHSHPLFKKADEHFDRLMVETKPNLFLAGYKDTRYTLHDKVLKAGDELFLFTDGVTEASNNNEELFTEPFLLKKANNYLSLPLIDFIESIKKEVDSFVSGAKQADDITMLVFRYKSHNTNNQ